MSSLSRQSKYLYPFMFLGGLIPSSTWESFRYFPITNQCGFVPSAHKLCKSLNLAIETIGGGSFLILSLTSFSHLLSLPDFILHFILLLISTFRSYNSFLRQPLIHPSFPSLVWHLTIMYQSQWHQHRMHKRSRNFTKYKGLRRHSFEDLFVSVLYKSVTPEYRSINKDDKELAKGKEH